MDGSVFSERPLGNPKWWPTLAAFTRASISNAGAPVAATRVWLTPVWFPRGMVVSRIGMSIATAGAAGATFRLGLYEDKGGTPALGKLLADSGDLDGTVVGITTFTLASPLGFRRGLTAWVAVVASDTTIRFTRHGTAQATFADVGSEIIQGGYYSLDAYGALLDPCPGSSSITADINLQLMAMLRIDSVNE